MKSAPLLFSIFTVFTATVFFAPRSAAAPQLLSQEIHEAVTRTAEQIQAGQHDKAERTLKRLERDSSLNPYERATISQQLGAIAIEKQDYRSAQKRFKAILEQKDLPKQFVAQLRFNLAQVYLLLERSRDAVALLRPILETAAESVPPAAYFLMAVALRDTGKTRQALQWAERGLDIASPPNESQYALALSLNLALERYKRAQQLLWIMVEQYPARSSYWRQLVQLAIRGKDHRRALAISEMAYHRKMLVGKQDVMRLVRLYLNQNLPHKAARMLDAALASRKIAPTVENWRLLSTAWSEAREYKPAVAALRKAAELSDNGRLYAHLGGLYIENRQWDEAERALSQALSKGGLKRPQEVRLLKGIALTELGRIGQAEAEFTHCLAFDNTYKQAAGWLQFLGSRNR